MATFPVKGRGNRWVAIITNGPQFAAQLMTLELKLGRSISKQAVQAGAEVIRDRWAGLVPTHEYYYQSSITFKLSSQSSKSSTGGTPEWWWDAAMRAAAAGRVLKGATAIIYPGPVAGPDDDEQPWRYAGVLEFGGRLSPAQHSSLIPAQPSARPAFDSSKDDAVDAVAAVLKRVL